MIDWRKAHKVVDATADAQEKAAKVVMERSQQLVPRRTGALARSEFIRRSGDTVVMGYGADHAIEVHERTEIPHSNGQAKFLEQAIKETSNELLREIGKNTKVR